MIKIKNSQLLLGVFALYMENKIKKIFTKKEKKNIINTNLNKKDFL